VASSIARQAVSSTVAPASFDITRPLKSEAAHAKTLEVLRLAHVLDEPTRRLGTTESARDDVHVLPGIVVEFPSVAGEEQST